MANRYRNTSEIYINDLFSVEEHSLWTRHKNTMRLVDDDQYITHPYHPTLFTLP
ncbi:MAG TPA: hypothetical protein VK050_06495 [Flavobacteriaceae bacterium]|nr:hypothetical protein [Flavobacteriaceae bacterium]